MPTQRSIKPGAQSSDNHIMRALLLSIALSLPAGAGADLPMGDGRFRLGMTRGEVLNMVKAEGGALISDRAGFLAATSPDSSVEFEQFIFFPEPNGPELLWKVSFAYRVPSTRDRYDDVERELRARLGEPAQVSDSATTGVDGAPRRTVWADARTTVQLAARWPEIPDPLTDRMRVTWIDRKIQRAVEARQRSTRKDRR